MSSQECECVDTKLEGDHVKCVTDAICSVYCQFKEKKATGRCEGENGWDCVCVSNGETNETI